MSVPAAVSTTADYVACAFCGSHHLHPRGDLPAAKVHETWLEKYDIPVQQYFPQGTITNFSCQTCGLDFFYPPSAGDSRMYEQLQRFPWYYEENKWEFRASLERLGAPGPALEVGCGTGNFLRALQRAGFEDVCGVDANRRALELLRAGGIEAFARLDHVRNRRFDYIFAFQVLEHIPTPRAFLDSLVPLLSEHGRIYVAVPNQDSFIGDDERQELNQPPHHCSRFRSRTFRHMSRFSPLECEQLAFEPLAPHHVGWYIATRLQKLPRESLTSRLAWRAAAPLAEQLLRFSPVRRRIHGHTMLAVLRHAPRGSRGGAATPTPR